MAKGGAISTSIPMVVLVDRGTASAAEIVTGALQDRHRAKVVGTHTYGKGVFQEIQPLPNGGALDITVGEYFTPSGRNLGGGGVREGAGIKPERLRRRQPAHRAPTRRSQSAETTVAAAAPVSAATEQRDRRDRWRTRRRARTPREVPGGRAVLRVGPAAGGHAATARPTSATWSWSAPAARGNRRGRGPGHGRVAGWDGPTWRAT